MQIFEELIKCKNCMHNINNVCIMYKGKNVLEDDAGCYCGIDKNKKIHEKVKE